MAGRGLGVQGVRVASCADAHDTAGLQCPGPSPMDIAEAAVQQMTSDQPADGET